MTKEVVLTQGKVTLVDDAAAKELHGAFAWLNFPEG